MPTSHLLAAEAPENNIVAMTIQTMPRGTSSLRVLPCLRSMPPAAVNVGPRLSTARSSIPQTALAPTDRHDAICLVGNISFRKIAQIQPPRTKPAGAPANPQPQELLVESRVQENESRNTAL